MPCTLGSVSCFDLRAHTITHPHTPRGFPTGVPLAGPYRRPRALGGPYGVELLLMGDVALYAVPQLFPSRVGQVITYIET